LFSKYEGEGSLNTCHEPRSAQTLTAPASDPAPPKRLLQEGPSGAAQGFTPGGKR